MTDSKNLVELGGIVGIAVFTLGIGGITAMLPQHDGYVVQGMLYLILAGLTVVYTDYVEQSQSPLSDLGFDGRIPAPQFIWIGIILGGAVFIVAGALEGVVGVLSGTPSQYTFRYSTAELLPRIVAVVALPIGHEVAYRGYVIPRANNYLQDEVSAGGVSVIVASLVVVPYGSVSVLLGAATVAAGCTVYYLFSDNTESAIIMHTAITASGALILPLVA